MAKASAKSAGRKPAKATKSTTKSQPKNKISELESVVCKGMESLADHCTKTLTALEKGTAQVKSKFEKASKRYKALKQKTVGKKKGPALKVAQGAAIKAQKEVHVLQAELNILKDELGNVREVVKKHVALRKHLDQFEKAWAKKAASQARKSGKRKTRSATKAAPKAVVSNPKARSANTARKRTPSKRVAA